MSREAKPGPRAAITISAAAPRPGSRAPTIPRPIYLLGYRQRWPLVRRSASRRQYISSIICLRRHQRRDHGPLPTPAQERLLRSWHEARAAYPHRRSSNANSLCGQNSAGSGESVRAFKGIFCDDISEFESSLSGRVGVKRFQTAPSIWFEMFTRRVLASLRDRHLGPPMMGSGGCGGPISRYVLAVRATAGIRLETDSPHPSSLRGHRSTDRRNSGFLLVFYCAHTSL